MPLVDASSTHLNNNGQWRADTTTSGRRSPVTTVLLYSWATMLEPRCRGRNPHSSRLSPSFRVRPITSIATLNSHEAAATGRLMKVNTRHILVKNAWPCFVRCRIWSRMLLAALVLLSTVGQLYERLSSQRSPTRLNQTIVNKIVKE